MTTKPDSVEERARELARDFPNTTHSDEEVVQWLAAALREERRKALRDAMKTVCRFCRGEVPEGITVESAELVDGKWQHHLVAGLPDGWYKDCEAAALRKEAGE